MVSPRTAYSLTLALVATLALAWSPASATAATGDSRAASRTSESQQSSYKTAAVRATNSVRARHDLLTLDADQCLQQFAVQAAAAMARQESMYHQDLGPIMRTCGLGLVGENVAYGYTNGREAVQGWMHSPGHRANILNRGFRVIAVAARESASGRWYAAQVFGRR